jgi:hypothetical protein
MKDPDSLDKSSFEKSNEKEVKNSLKETAPLGSQDNPYDLETEEGCKAFIDWLEKL